MIVAVFMGMLMRVAMLMFVMRMFMLMAVAVLVRMFVTVSMRMFMGMRVLVVMTMLLVMMAVVVSMLVAVTMFMVVIVREVDIELHTGDALTVLTADVQVVAIELELGEFAFELLRINAEIDERGDEHIAADAAENIEIQCLHTKLLYLTTERCRVNTFYFSTNALIWLAA